MKAGAARGVHVRPAGWVQRRSSLAKHHSNSLHATFHALCCLPTSRSERHHQKRHHRQHACTMSSMKSNSNEQLLKTFWEMDRSMLQAHRGCETNRAQADDTAHALLEYAELSLLIRARTLMVLGCSDQPGTLLSMGMGLLHDLFKLTRDSQAFSTTRKKRYALPSSRFRPAPT